MIKLETRLNDTAISFETGRLAKQANGSVLASCGDTRVLVTATASAEPREGADFLPLMVDYQEMFYGSGKIPGNYFRREIGRPSEKATLTSRLIDRPLRPRFPNGYTYDTQIIATVLSVDPSIDPDVIAITAASAALTVSDIPFDGPIAGLRVGRVDGKFIPNPTIEQLSQSDIDIVVAGSRENIVMVEGWAAILPEEEVLEAILFARDALKPLIEIQDELAEKAGKPKFAVQAPEPDSEVVAAVEEKGTELLREVISISEKVARNTRKREVKKQLVQSLSETYPDREKEIGAALKDIEKRLMRQMIVKERRRLDGRGFTDVRPITCTVGELPRAHGSAVFTRGETQVLAVATLGSADDEQRIDTPFGDRYKPFMLHYNFTPYSVGEVRMMRGPARRDIGHGALAERAVAAVIPLPEDFLYTIRVVSEVLESNGSSSMASVCGATLALMDAGVPIRDMVSGVAMGLIKDEESGEAIILTDILGDEDHLGDMDFKVAGTEEGITALQMDIKINEIDEDILKRALSQAREGRIHILGKMQETMKEPRSKLSEFAPRITSIKINPEKIKDVIGPGGKVIKGIIADTGVKMDVDDSGTVNIFSSDAEAADKALQIVKDITREPEIGEVYTGTVKKIMDFGAFVEILPRVDGLVHISQLENHRVENVRDVLKEGDTVKVKVIDIDRQGRIKLSRKALLD